MITQENIDAVVAFLPALETIRKGHAAHHPEHSLESEYHLQVRSLIRTFNKINFVQPFDGPSWQSEAERLHTDPELLSRADLDTCCKLITFHIRKDRFNGGHFGAMVETNHILRPSSVD